MKKILSLFIVLGLLFGCGSEELSDKEKVLKFAIDELDEYGLSNVSDDIDEWDINGPTKAVDGNRWVLVTHNVYSGDKYKLIILENDDIDNLKTIYMQDGGYKESGTQEIIIDETK